MVDTCGSAPYLRSSSPSRFQNLRSFLTFRRTAVQLSSERSKILPRYLKVSSPYMHSASSSPVRLNVSPSHRLIISTSFLRHRINHHRLLAVSYYLSSSSPPLDPMRHGNKRSFTINSSKILFRCRKNIEWNVVGRSESQAPEEVGRVPCHWRKQFKNGVTMTIFYQPC